MNKIKQLRGQQNLSQTALAELANTTQAQINRLENDDRKLTVDWLNRLGKALGCNPWEIAWPESIDETSDTSIVGEVGAGQEVIPFNDIENSEHAETVKAPSSLGKVVAVIIKGDSMLPTYREGDVIFYRPHKGHPSPLINKECIVHLEDGRTLIKILHKGSRKGLFTLSSYNAEPMFDEKIQWAGPVLWVKRYA